MSSKPSPRRRAAARAQTELAGATISEFDGVRYLHLGTDWVQGAMRIRKPRALELEYIQRMMAWMLWRPTEQLTQGRALQLGLGAGAITRFTHQELHMHTTVVEINATVIAANKLWFQLPHETFGEDGQILVVEGDAAAWVQDPAHLQCAEVLCVDLYDHEAAAPVLDDADFYRACRGLLSDGGLMTVNLFGRDASFEASAARIAEAFGSDQVWQLAPTKEGNTIVVAGRGVVVPDRETLTSRAEAIEARCGLPARKWLRLVKPWRPAA